MWNDIVMRDMFIVKKFEKSDISDLFKGNLSNLCLVHFIRLFTINDIVLIGSSKNIYTIRIWRKYLFRILVTWSKCQIRDFSYPTAYWSRFGIFKQNQDNPDEIGMDIKYRRRSEFRWIITETKPRGLFCNIH